MSEDQRAGGEVPPQPAAGASPPSRSKGEPVHVSAVLAETLTEMDVPEEYREGVERVLGNLRWRTPPMEVLLRAADLSLYLELREQQERARLAGQPPP